MADDQSMQDVLRMLSTLVAKLEQREARMQAAVDRKLQVVQDEVAQLHQRVGAIVDSAQASIAREAGAAIKPLVAEYGVAVGNASARLHRASATVWAWYGGLAGLSLLLAVVGWGVLGYYQRELAATKAELARYENAVPVVRAFHASDAVVCGDRICVNVDASGQRQGGHRQYLPARPRPSR